MGVVRLKLLEIKDKDKVIFAEAGKEFVDLLMGLMQIPLGSILRLLKQNVQDEPSLSLEKLYGSIHSFEDSYLQNSDLINNVLDPKFTLDTEVKQPPILKQLFQGSGSSSSSSSPEEIDGYVKGAVTYMVMDDLTILPSSAIDGIKQFKMHDIHDITSLDEKTVEVDAKKALELVRAAFQSSTALTHVFTSKERGISVNPIPEESQADHF